MYFTEVKYTIVCVLITHKLTSSKQLSWPAADLKLRLILDLSMKQLVRKSEENVERSLCNQLSCIECFRCICSSFLQYYKY